MNVTSAVWIGKAVAGALADVAKGERKANKTPKKDRARDCACGCGNQTKGGRWMPGHDAKCASTLLEAGRDAARRVLLAGGTEEEAADAAAEATRPAREALALRLNQN